MANARSSRARLHSSTCSVFPRTGGDRPGEAGAATEEGDPPTTMSWGGEEGGKGGVSNNMLHRGQNNL